MRRLLALVLSLISSGVMADAGDDELKAAGIHEFNFGWTIKNPSIDPDSVCARALKGEAEMSKVDPKTDDEKARKLVYHVNYINCVGKAMWVGDVNYVSADVEKKYCDDASFSADVADILAKADSIKVPPSKDPLDGRGIRWGKYDKFLKLTQELPHERPENCARYFARHINDPKDLPKEVVGH